VPKGADEFDRKTGCFPGGKPFGVDWEDFVDFFAITVWNTVNSIAGGADERDKESRESCF
jgi:hypothetical protein